MEAVTTSDDYARVTDAVTAELVARLEGGNLVMPLSRTVTAEEWNSIRWPPCPRCGATIRAERIDATAFGEREAHYIAGRAECPNEHELG